MKYILSLFNMNTNEELRDSKPQTYMIIGPEIVDKKNHDINFILRNVKPHYQANGIDIKIIGDGIGNISLDQENFISNSRIVILGHGFDEANYWGKKSHSIRLGRQRILLN